MAKAKDTVTAKNKKKPQPVPEEMQMKRDFARRVGKKKKKSTQPDLDAQNHCCDYFFHTYGGPENKMAKFEKK